MPARCDTCFYHDEAGCQRTDGQHCLEENCRRTDFSYWQPQYGVVVSAALLRPLLVAALHDCQQCAYWPPRHPDEFYTCRNECLHRTTCEVLYAIIQGTHKAHDIPKTT